MIAGQLEFAVDNWHDTSGIIAIIATSLATFGFIFSIWSCYKIRTVLMPLRLLHQTHSVSALIPKPPLSFIHQSPESTNTTTIDEHIYSSFTTPWPYVSLSVITTLLVIACITYLWSKFVQTHLTTIHLEITTGPVCDLIQLITLPLCPNNWHIQPPQGILDNLKFVCRRELTILPEIEIRHRGSDDQLSSCTKDFVSEAILRRCGMTDIIYPPLNGKQEIPFKVFNVTCSQWTDVEADRTIKIMWSNINPNFPERGSWTANHVVPLADREIPQEAESSTNVDLADSFELDSFMSTSSSERPLDITLSPITSSSPVPEVHTKTAKYHPHGTLNNGTFMETEMLNILFGKSKNTNIKRFRTHQR
uniref:Uncharacterized protein n=1 Tax=Magallana gigas TaxID=29159 RepID=A0A8W8IJ09_MAGGI